MTDVVHESLYTGEIVRATGVKRSFGTGAGTVDVLRGVDLEVQAGQLVALFGPSGSGKTTLLNLVGALDQPSAGEISLCGKDIVHMSEGRRSRLRRKQVSFIFQRFTLLPTYTALENIDLALRLPGIHYFERRQRARAALEAVGLSAWANHVPEELSGGQQQRIAIARALALRPAVILADEPTNSLDTRTSRRVLALFHGIARRQGTAFLIVSHDAVVNEFVDAAYDLQDGTLAQRQPHLNGRSNEDAFGKSDI
jgi:putative ABC transport system ATP-binding protein